MDAFKLLEQDHQKVKKLLSEGDDTTERRVKTREELFARIKQELLVHESIEEEEMFPKARKVLSQEIDELGERMAQRKKELEAS